MPVKICSLPVFLTLGTGHVTHSWLIRFGQKSAGWDFRNIIILLLERESLIWHVDFALLVSFFEY